MKAKIKSVLFCTSIFYSVFIVVLMLFTFSTITDSVELYDNDENKNKLSEYKKIVSKLEDNECKNFIRDIIKYYEDTSYNGSVNLKEMYDYDDNNGLLSYYIKVKDACYISETDEKVYDFPTKFISSIMYREVLYQKYYFQYELKFTDMYMRDIGEAAIHGTMYNASRNIVLDIILGLIEISSREVADE